MEQRCSLVCLYICTTKYINIGVLLLTDVPAMVSTDNKIYQIRYSESFSGNIFTRVDNGPFTSLKDVFNQIIYFQILCQITKVV